MLDIGSFILGVIATILVELGAIAIAVVIGAGMAGRVGSDQVQFAEGGEVDANKPSESNS